jgi:hypothetical protein
MEFLSALRAGNATGSTWFWADQISINQNDIAERGHQVDLMSEIFSHARCVYSCIGALPAANILDPDTLLPDFWELDNNVLDYWILGDGRSVRTLLTLMDLASRPYWRRLWVVQECRLAQDVLVWFGNIRIPARKMLRVITRCFKQNSLALHRNLKRSHSVMEEDDRVRLALEQALEQSDLETFTSAVNYMISLFAELHSESLYDIIKCYECCACVDPRDKIYGLQAIVKVEERVTVDYSLSLSQVMLETFRIMLSDPRFLSDLFVDWYWLIDEMIVLLLQIGEAEADSGLEKKLRSMLFSHLCYRTLVKDDKKELEAASHSYKLDEYLNEMQAVTSHQMALAEELRKICWDSDNGTRQPIERIGPNVDMVIRRLGFIVNGKFLVHPEDSEWPLSLVRNDKENVSMRT